MDIQVWSDIACPWCWVGKKHLEMALKGFEDDIEVTWRAFELNPAAPATPTRAVDYAERLAAKYGMARTQAQGFIDRMTQAGAAVGVDMRFDRIRPCNTFNAHRLLAWARSLDHQNSLKDRLFKAYLNEGLDLNDVSTLSRLASKVGLDMDDAAAVLGTDAFGEEVRSDQAEARRLGIQGVPFFVFGPGIVASGAQPPEVLRGAFLEAQRRQAAEQDASTVDAAPVCGVDGCD